MSAATEPPRIDDAELAALVSGGAATLALPLTATQVDHLVAYVRLIQRWSATYNLTAIRDPRDIVTQHILDSLAAAAALFRRRGIAPGERLLDVGSGAGLPGVVIGVAAPEREVVCVDSVGKKTAFITHAAGILGLKNVTALHQRVETVVGSRFDVVASRAFSSLQDFVAATRHLLDERGTWMAMKGKAPHAELEEIEGLSYQMETLAVPGLDADRCIVWIQYHDLGASARL